MTNNYVENKSAARNFTGERLLSFFVERKGGTHETTYGTWARYRRRCASSAHAGTSRAASPLGPRNSPQRGAAHIHMGREFRPAANYLVGASRWQLPIPLLVKMPRTTTR